MNIKCSVCGNYYFVDENLEPSKAMGPYICSIKCLQESQTLYNQTDVTQIKEFIVGTVEVGKN